MNLDEQRNEFEKIVNNARSIMLSKGNDYADDDRLSNFKLVSQITGLKVTDVINVFIATKTVRMGNILKKMTKGELTKAENESLQDNRVDLINYTMLLEMAENEEKFIKKAK